MFKKAKRGDFKCVDKNFENFLLVGQIVLDVLPGFLIMKFTQKLEHRTFLNVKKVCSVVGRAELLSCFSVLAALTYLHSNSNPGNNNSNTDNNNTDNNTDNNNYNIIDNNNNINNIINNNSFVALSTSTASSTQNNIYNQPNVMRNISSQNAIFNTTNTTLARFIRAATAATTTTTTPITYNDDEEATKNKTATTNAADNFADATTTTTISTIGSDKLFRRTFSNLGKFMLLSLSACLFKETGFSALLVALLQLLHCGFHSIIIISGFLTHLFASCISLWLLVEPLNLSYDWSADAVPLVTSSDDVRNICSAFVVFGAVTLFCLTFKNSSASSFFLSYALFFCPFLLTTNLFYTVGYVVAERAMYLPSTGFILLAVQLIQKFSDSKSMKGRLTCYGPIASIILAGYLCYLANVTRTRCEVWMDRSSLYRSAVLSSRRPANAKQLYNLANLLRDEGHFGQAVQYYKQAVRQWPTFASAKNNLALLLDDVDQSEFLYRDVMRSTVCHTSAMINLANLLNQKNQLDESVIILWKIIQCRPDLKVPYIVLSSIASNLNQHSLVKHYTRAINDISSTDHQKLNESLLLETVVHLCNIHGANAEHGRALKMLRNVWRAGLISEKKVLSHLYWSLGLHLQDCGMVEKAMKGNLVDSDRYYKLALRQRPTNKLLLSNHNKLKLAVSKMNNGKMGAGDKVTDDADVVAAGGGGGFGWVNGGDDDYDDSCGDDDSGRDIIYHDNDEDSGRDINYHDNDEDSSRDNVNDDTDIIEGDDDDGYDKDTNIDVNKSYNDASLTFLYVPSFELAYNVSLTTNNNTQLTKHRNNNINIEVSSVHNNSINRLDSSNNNNNDINNNNNNDINNNDINNNNNNDFSNMSCIKNILSLVSWLLLQ
ncbi:hypothetical protein HELRODRAFT_172478 [Helobdella robusta]|uniref:dolichyl-phosphate-mannose--protein mannosyltransferase n=1 Tax=Helobdella robusta TaxID=6412 RepID=T1F5D5_HELRO|nr:hypothetical protein HELRODRAFT_172478 [Helobdella robusta]ESO04803.1 hypothetical protein HELRODRAFT_172478 [Helobdella robusta]